MSTALILDIETEPLPDAKLLETFVPPEPLKHPGEFNPADVKTGHLKQQDKIDQKIADERAKHEQAVKDYASKEQERHWDALNKYRDKAALDPMTGSICVIGVMTSDSMWDILEGDERDVLLKAWNAVEMAMANRSPIIGHCLNTFDLPFMVKRSWLLQVQIPDKVLPPPGRPWWPEYFVDLNERWNIGSRGREGSLNDIGEFFGLGGKTDDCDGANFWKMWRSGNSEEREAARRYLHRDLQLTLEVCNRMRIL